jgi:putative endopeptidase
MNILKPALFTAALSLSLASGAATKEHLKSLDASSIDNNTPAATDFYRHVNKGWMDSHPLTAEYARYGQFNVLTDSSNNRVNKIVMGLADTNPQPGTDAYRVATIYSMAMDSVRRNKLGATPLQIDLNRINKAKPEEMTDLFLWLQENYTSPFFSAGPQEDLGNSQVYAMYVSGGGMGLGDRDYYLLNDENNKKVREAYKVLINKYMRLAGFSKSDANRIVKNVMKIETALADSAWTREESRNLPAMYNVRSMSELKDMYPNIPWDRYFVETMNINPEQVIVTEINSVKQADNLFGSLSDREKKDYYMWQYVRQAAPYLSDDFTNAGFEFSKVMSGVEKQQPRWKRALNTTQGLLGESIGKLYVEQYFPASSKEYMIGLVENLRTALGKHIQALTWMSDETKEQALKKLQAITVKIGYPDKWKDYSTMTINPNLSFYENVHNAQKWHSDEELAKWGKPVDRTEWHMLPQTINAYYNPMNNEIVFPAGILQAPFYDPEASDAENYGGIGVVIGHELTHGFDDQGCNFDADGNMTNWWTPADAEAFASLTQGLATQFSEVEVLPGLNANGQYTLGENIADQGGLRIAYTAFLNSQDKKGVDINSEDALIDGFTPSQVFYMNFANLWAQNIRPEEIRNLTIGDVHSLGENRVNVSIRNIAPFFEAFGIKDGDKMFRPESERVVIW